MTSEPRQGAPMREDQPYNVAIAEIERDGRIARIAGNAATEADDAIRFIVDLMAQEGIPGERVLRLDSEREPNPEWQEYFAAHWPNAAITWSFTKGQDAEMEAAVDRLPGKAKKPWWQFR